MHRIYFLLFFVAGSLLAKGQSYEELNNKLMQLYKEGKYAEAIPIAIKAKDAAEKESGNTSNNYSQSLNNLGILYKSMGNYAAAIPLYKEALAIRKKVLGEEHLDYATSLNNLARLHLIMRNYAAAEPLYKQSATILKKVLGEEHPYYTTCINNLAILYLSIGNYAAADPLYKQVLAINKKVLGEEHPDYASSLNNLAHLYKTIGKYSAAEPLYKQALAIRKKVLGEEHPNYAESLNNMAGLYKSMGNYTAAETLYKQALAVYIKVLGEEHPNYATCLNNLAELYHSMGNYTAAEPLHKQAMAIRKEVLGEENADYAESLNNLAYLYQSMGNYNTAEPLYKQALAIFKKILGEEHTDYVSSLNNLAGLYQSVGNYAGAGLLLKQSLITRKKVLGEEHPDYASSLNNLAELYRSTGNYAAAEPLYKQALAIRKKVFGEKHASYAESLNNLAYLYHSIGRYAAAEHLYIQASTIFKEEEEYPKYAQSLNNLAFLYEGMGNYPRAAHYSIAGTHLAFNHIEKNFNNLSEDEKLKWWESLKGNFQVASSLLFTNPNLSITFLQQICNQQLQLKGFVLNDGAKVLQEARKKSNPLLRQLLNNWETNRATLAKQYSLPISKRMPQLDSLEKQTNEQEKQINSQSVVFRMSQANKQIGFSEVRQQLKQDEAAVEFIRFHYCHKRWTDSVLYSAFIILPDDTIPHFVTLCEEKRLAGLLDSKDNSSEQFVKQLYRGVTLSNSQHSKKGDSLFKLIWKPLMPWLKGVRKINIAPAGLLNRVAFSALPIDHVTYLIDKYQLRQYSSVRQIAEQKISLSNTDASNDAVLYGGIEFNAPDTITSSNEIVSNRLPDDVKRSIRGGEWNSLPGTLQEVKNISELFNTNKKTTRVITSTAATEESFKHLSGHSPTILHLATHGFSLPDAEQKRKDNVNNNENQFTLADNPLLRSGIIMAGANRVWSGGTPVAGKEDGIVTAYEISNLDLSNTELVVLSACETALGDIKGTEGVFGLQRAFKLAGVQNMILSLWQVPDRETAELMNLLYTNKLKGMTIYEAFNKAQDIMRKKYSPYYWAAFVLIE